jgi:hypothetical protein
MQLAELKFRQSQTEPGSKFALVASQHITIWRHADGTYTIRKRRKRKKDCECWPRVDLMAAQAILYHLVPRGAADQSNL